MNDRRVWEGRYADRAPAGIAAATELLTRHRQLLPASGYALDVACGDGRHALWLARQGFTVDAIDIAHSALSRLTDLARREGLAVRAVQADLEHFDLAAARYAVVVNTRYLQRSLLPALRRGLRPGGVVAFETFLREQARIGHPRNPDYLLEAGELRSHFAGLEILVDQEGLFDTAGGPTYLARLLARHPHRGTLD
jgi:SAM-dependent methyltransferase